MESGYYAPPAHRDASAPSWGFPLGTALLLMIIFGLSGAFSCCYHWDKLRSLRRSFSGDADLEADGHGSPSKPITVHLDSLQEKSQSLPVLMPGDRIPKFIALPRPCEPPAPDRIIAQLPPPPPPKPPRMAVPLY
ncbi:hypothetical protein U1Q18_012043 [Sarracenia purpurea var. burkii]